jgi:hypothetical protein
MFCNAVAQRKMDDGLTFDLKDLSFLLNEYHSKKQTCNLTQSQIIDPAVEATVENLISAAYHGGRRHRLWIESNLKHFRCDEVAQAMFVAIKYKNNDIVIMLRPVADITVLNNALYMAAYDGDIHACHDLIRFGANDFDLAMCHALVASNDTVCKWLLDKGIDNVRISEFLRTIR